MIFQAGSYTKEYYEYPDQTKEICNSFMGYLETLEFESIFEAGVGKANKLVNLLSDVRCNKIKRAGGCDLSWSRIKAAQLFADDNKDKINLMPDLFVGDMTSLPLMDNSVDLIYTMYSLEPNGGREKELMREIARVSARYVVMLEPSYEFANAEQRARMDEHGYVKGLLLVAEEIGLKVLDIQKFPIDENPMNPTAIILCEKQGVTNTNDDYLACPITKTKLDKIEDCYFSKDSLLAYPIIQRVPLLTEDNAVVATKLC